MAMATLTGSNPRVASAASDRYAHRDRILSARRDFAVRAAAIAGEVTRRRAGFGVSEFQIRVCYLLAALAAATILSKRLSPRKESQHGLKRRESGAIEVNRPYLVHFCAGEATSF
jgi:hypothetical protein